MTVSEPRTAWVRHANNGEPHHVEARWESPEDDDLMTARPELHFFIDHHRTAVIVKTAHELRFVVTEFGEAVLLPALRVIRQRLLKDAGVIVDDDTLKRLLSVT